MNTPSNECRASITLFGETHLLQKTIVQPHRVYKIVLQYTIGKRMWAWFLVQNTKDALLKLLSTQAGPTLSRHTPLTHAPHATL